MKKNILLFISLLFACVGICHAQYYNTAFGLNGAPLKTALHQIIKNHTVLTYDDLWNAFQQTDKKGNGLVWDIYTDVPGGIPQITFQFVADQCGNYNAEGDCYNREHTWPKNYFNDDYPMYSDLHQIYPTDGWVNNKRAAYPYGNVSNITYTSLSNASKLGKGSTYTGYTDKIFEPVDSFKGDLARAYFYMSTRYESEDAGWNNWVMANGAQLTADAVTLLISWHHNDPVSQKEVDRNNAIAAIQNNRNPFIDYPMFADCIWGTGDCISIGIQEHDFATHIKLYPIPADQELNIEYDHSVSITRISIFDLSGRTLFNEENPDQHNHHKTINLSSLHEGTYLMMMNTSQGVFKQLFSKN